MTDDEQRAEWHLDRKFSATLIIAILAQIGTGVWFASKTDSRIVALEERYVELAETLSKDRAFHTEHRVRLWDRVNAQAESLNEFRAEMAGVNAKLGYISQSLDRLTLLNDQRIRDERRDSEQ